MQLESYAKTLTRLLGFGFITRLEWRINFIFMFIVGLTGFYYLDLAWYIAIIISFVGLIAGFGIRFAANAYKGRDEALRAMGNQLFTDIKAMMNKNKGESLKVHNNAIRDVKYKDYKVKGKND